MATDRETIEEKPTYWARIPSQIRYDNDLHPGAKVLYSEIDCLSKRKGFCWAQNNYFEDKFGISTDTVTRWIKQLILKDYISCQINKAKGNIRILSPIPKSTLDLMNNSGSQDDPIRKDADSYPQKSGDPIRKDADSYNRMNKKREQEEREGKLSLALPDFLNPKKQKGKIYLTAQHGYQLASTGFFEWFENEVLKRFIKFNANVLNDTTIRDWDEKVFKKYGADISTAGVMKLLDQTRGNLPGWNEAAKEGKKIFDQIKAGQDRKKADQQRAEIQKNPKCLIPDYEKMRDEELVKTYLLANAFVKDRIKRKRPEVVGLAEAASRTAV